MIEGGERKVYYYFHNHQGFVIAMVDGEGNIVNVYDYWADGNLRYISEEVEQPFLYTGAYYDRETGLYYLRARYYSPELRRFTQRDPILFEGGINLYSYTGCDFVNRGDWEGKWGAIIGRLLWKWGRRILVIYYFYKCKQCFEKLNSHEFKECKERVFNPDRCIEGTYAFPSSEVLKECAPEECFEACRKVFEFIERVPLGRGW